MAGAELAMAAAVMAADIPAAGHVDELVVIPEAAEDIPEAAEDIPAVAVVILEAAGIRAAVLQRKSQKSSKFSF